MQKQLLALATFSGTIIGVGLFGLPYVTSRIGFGPILLYFLALGCVILSIHLMYGEVVCRTNEPHRLPGYVKLYLNAKLAKLSAVTTTLGLTGALLAYLMVGGGFLANLLQPIFGGTEILYVFFFFASGAIIIYFGSGSVSRTELLSLGIFFLVLAILFYKSLAHIDFDNYLHVDMRYALLPYGVILFSMMGTAVIPETKEILGRNQESKLLRLIAAGTIIPIITYLLFVITVVGVTGADTTQEGLRGLHLALGDGVVYFGFLFGILTTFTSYLALGITLKKQFVLDLGLRAFPAWLLAVIPSFLLYLLGMKDFIVLIGFIGAGLGAIDMTLVVLTFLRSKTRGQRVPPYLFSQNKILIGAILTLFLVGFVLEIAGVLGVGLTV